MSELDPDAGSSTSPENPPHETPASEIPANDLLSAQFTQPPPQRDPVFWGWHDLFLFIFISILSLGVAMLAAIGIRHLLHLSEARMNIVFVIAQFAAYGVSFTCLKLMFQAEYGEPLLSSLRWVSPRTQPGALALIGLGQAFLIAIIGSFMRVPQTENPMTRLMSDRATSIVVAVLGVTVAPMAEELAFRGLLQPLTIRLMGVVPGIVCTGLLFGFMHLEQYASWQSVVLIALAGTGFGIMRYVTGSTKAAAIMHAGYNSALFILFFTQKGPPH